MNEGQATTPAEGAKGQEQRAKGKVLFIAQLLILPNL